VTYFNSFSLSSTVRSRAAVALVALATAGLLAGCGSSRTTETITIGNENPADNALINASATNATKATEPPATATATTPTSGPLSKQPKILLPNGPAPTKLVVKDLITGTGAEAKPGAKVTVNYVGALYNGGKIFDASWLRKQPSTFGLSEVIPGWTEGIPGMKVGGRRELIIPSALAYGTKGSGAKIPPNAPLVFVIDLLATS
jgi:peptidylprolyl isomerase